MKTLILNDLHFGVIRQGGTTPQSQVALREYLRSSVTHVLSTSKADHVVINGDLFDGFTVEVSEVIKVYELFADWIHESNGRLTLISGNHDVSAKGDRVSSFHLLCHFLKARFPEQVFVIDHTNGLTAVHGNIWAISHCLNQELFNIEIDKAIASPPPACSYLLLHCNYKNTFAENSDHSLNLNDDQVGALMRAGWNLILGHEHCGYELRGGRVVVTGNQFASSIADCIGEKVKRAAVIDGNVPSFVVTQRMEDVFCEVDWRDLGNGPFILKHFYRIVGEASAAEAADVVSAIAKFRQECCADVFAISNAVKVEGHVALDEAAVSTIESVKAFDVVSAIMEKLEPREVEVVKGLINA